MKFLYFFGGKQLDLTMSATCMRVTLHSVIFLQDCLSDILLCRSLRSADADSLNFANFFRCHIHSVSQALFDMPLVQPPMRDIRAVSLRQSARSLSCAASVKQCPRGFA